MICRLTRGRFAPALHVLVLILALLPAWAGTPPLSPALGVVVLRLTTDTRALGPNLLERGFTSLRCRDEGAKADPNPDFAQLFPDPRFQFGTQLFIGAFAPGRYELVSAQLDRDRNPEHHSSWPLPGFGSFEVQAGRITHLGLISLISGQEGPIPAAFWAAPEELPAIRAAYPQLEGWGKGGEPLGWDHPVQSGPANAWARSEFALVNRPTWFPDGTLLGGARLGRVVQRDRSGTWSLLDTGAQWEVVQVLRDAEGALLALLETGELRRTLDGGRTWSRVPAPVPGVIAAALDLQPGVGGWVGHFFINGRLLTFTRANGEVGPWVEIARSKAPTWEDYSKDRIIPPLHRFHARIRTFAGAGGFVFAFPHGAVYRFDQVRRAWTISQLGNPLLDLGPWVGTTEVRVTQEGVFHGEVARGEFLGAAETAKRTLTSTAPFPRLRGLLALAVAGSSETLVALKEDLPVVGMIRPAFSVDGGLSWETAGPGVAGAPNWLCASPDGSVVLYQDGRGEIFASHDRGKRWNLELPVVAEKQARYQAWRNPR
ncbi:MAG TPA: hypothetical protein VJ623_04660 [Holophagaceae bacterium]|nr:hypothetical protein [Holophagaceae bacterium]